MLPFEEARRRILERFAPLALEKVALLAAPGRVLGEDLTAGWDLPPFTHAAMDGYALRREDSRGASPKNPAVLTVGEVISAGRVPARAVGPGEAARIMTGAPLPPGADAVVPLEEVRPDKERVSLFREARAGEAVRRAGSLVRKGDRILARGETVRPADVGLLASLGIAAPAVHQRPQVAVIATGDELTEIDAPPTAGRIVGDNSYTLAALVADCGAIPLRLPLVRDRREELAATFRAAARADLIVSAGGVSAGDYDLVRPLLQEPGNRLDFWQVAMTPGRALAFGAAGGVPVIALSGSPFAVLVGFEQFARPVIRKLQGRRDLFRRTFPALLAGEVNKKPGLRAFSGARIERAGEGFRAVPAGKGSAITGEPAIRANGLIVLPEAATRVGAGETVAVQLLDDGLAWTAAPD